MSTLKIDSFLETTKTEDTTTTTVEKNAEVEKTAADHVLEVVDQSNTLVSIGEALHKFASESEELAPLAAVGEDLFNIGSRMGAALSKTAASEPYALTDSLEIAEDLHKVASVFANIADEISDEELSKDAEEVIKIANILTEEANEFYETMKAQETQGNDQTKEAGVAETAKGMYSKMKAHFVSMGHSAAEAGKKATKAVDEHVGKHPKKYMAAAAAGGTVMGYMAGHKKDKK